MELTISMNTVLNFLHSMPLSTSNKQWLADHLYEEVKAEKKAAGQAGSDWPKLCRKDLHISPEVMRLVEDIEPLPDDFDENKVRLEYLFNKHE